MDNQTPNQMPPITQGMETKKNNSLAWIILGLILAVGIAVYFYMIPKQKNELVTPEANEVISTPQNSTEVILTPSDSIESEIQDIQIDGTSESI